MENKDNSPSLGLKWTWHIFLTSNILVVLGSAITWILLSKTAISPQMIMLPSTICNLLAIAGVFLFYFFDSKDIWLIKSHVNKKWINLYLSSGFVFVIAVIFNFIFISFYTTIAASIGDTTFFLIDLIITSIVSVISIGIYRFGRFKIDIAIFKRRRGEMSAEPKNTPATPTTTSSGQDDQASSKLVDNATKQ